MVEVVRGCLGHSGVDRVALDDAGVVGAGMVDGGVEEAGCDAVAAVLAAHHEARDRPDRGVVEGFGGLLEGARARQARLIGAR